MRPPLPDAVAAAVLRPAAWAAVAGPLLIATFVGLQAWPALRASGGAAFLTDPDWAPTSGRYAIAPMIAGTVVSSVVALALAAPVSVAYGLHVNLFAGPRLAAWSRAGVGLLAGIPSVVFGLVALTTLVPLLVIRHPPGLGLGVTVLTLGAMILPTAAVTVDAAVQQVDRDAIRAVLALGLGRWDAARAVVLPLAARGIRAGLLLALGRAIGETMAVLMVAGNTVAWPTGPFASFRTLTGNIAVEMAYATGVHRSALFVSAAVLFVLVGAVVALEHRRA
ncbi:MAG: ABC transporter permease subunit [Myxococcota bacterium]